MSHQRNLRSWRFAILGLAMATLFSACGLWSEPEPPTPPRRLPSRTPVIAATPSPTPTTRPAFQETDTEDGVSPTPSPSPSASPVSGSESQPASIPEPESLLAKIGPSTPPNTAAALRLIEEARLLLAHGDSGQALHRLERSVTVDPLNAYGYYFLARIHRDNSSYDQAIAFAGRAASLAGRTDPGWESRSYSLQGAVYEQVGRFADARQAYNKALRSDPRNATARAGLGRLSGEH